MAPWRKLGIIAGGGELPVVLAEHCASTRREYFVARVTPFADPVLESHPGASHDLGAMGARIAALRANGCDAVTLLGQVPRVDLTKLTPDDGAMAMLPALMAAMPNGDDALLRALLLEHEKVGFRVIGADEAMAELIAKQGAWGVHSPRASHLSDIARAAYVAAATGALDIGQGVVVCNGLVLAVEAQEGTDAMLCRVQELREDLRGTPQHRRGVLVKRPKPMQERRIDLPTVGIRTVELAAAAGLAGVAVEAAGALVVRRDAMIVAADSAGLFLYGFAPAEIGGS